MAQNTTTPRFHSLHLAHISQVNRSISSVYQSKSNRYASEALQ